MSLRIRFVIDPDAQFEECNGEARPLTPAEYEENYYMREGRRVPYSEYLAYYGNPDRHVYLQAEVEKRCDHCGHWEYINGVGGIDFMDDSPELRAVDKWFSEDQVDEIPGYLQEIARGELKECDSPEGTEGQDRESYTDTQDRENYSDEEE